ncbi:hypothetical protein SGLAD_v1c06590 [Spiroplasma gladiatoris]|uniref:Uncharacterized protein n=1 Tax=Spiroplasma gladiatoris TaxID=2143 RepID=A0A4P7AJ90_9MOLU|nr:hypothetical protein SGLAD_v1c06590 [Spiroplasma gladiatoris]
MNKIIIILVSSYFVLFLATLGLGYGYFMQKLIKLLVHLK